MRRAVWVVGLVLAALLLGGCPQPDGGEGEPQCVNEQNDRATCPTQWTGPPYGVPERIWQ